MHETPLSEQFDEWQRAVRHRATGWAGDLASVMFKGLTGSGVVAFAQGNPGPWTYALGYLGVGLGIAVRSYVAFDAQKERENDLLNFYRAEVGAMMDKPAGAVTRDDLHAVAGAVPVIQEALDRSTRQRNAEIASWGISSVATGTLMMLVVGPMLGTAGFMGVAMGFGPVGVIFGAIATSFVLFQVAHTLVSGIAARVADVNEPSTHDRLRMFREQLSTHQPLQPLQIFDYLVSAQPALAARVEEATGQPYAALDHAAQVQLLTQLDPNHEITTWAYDINHGHMRLAELAFLACGQRSGVPLATPAAEVVAPVGQQWREKVARGEMRVTQAVGNAKERLTEWRERVRHKDKAPEASAEDKGGETRWTERNAPSNAPMQL